MKTITLGQFIDAIEKNGLPQAFGTWFSTEANPKYDEVTWSPPKSEIKAACAIGQAALNLGVDLEHLRSDNDFIASGIIGTIETWNDEDKLPLFEIAKRARETWGDSLDKEFGTFPERRED